MDYLSDLKQHIELIEQQFPFIQQEKAKNCLEGLQVQMNTFIQLSTKQQDDQLLAFQFAGLLGNASLFLFLLLIIN